MAGLIHACKDSQWRSLSKSWRIKYKRRIMLHSRPMWCVYGLLQSLARGRGSTNVGTGHMSSPSHKMSQHENVRIYPQSNIPLAFCWQCNVSLHWNISKNISSEISKSEEGGRRGVLLPGKEWCRTCAVSPANDGSLWVSKRLSQSFQRPFLRLSSIKKSTSYAAFCNACGECYQSHIQKTYYTSKSATSGWQV